MFMSKVIQVDQLAKEVMDGLEEYAKLATDVLKKEIQEAGKAAKMQIEQTAPRRTGKYAKSWAVKKTSETSNSLEVTVHSKTRYALAHLLENGHAKRGGGRVAAIPHIAPAEEAAVQSLERNIETALGRL
jgi:hypothetical protein